MFQNYLDTIFKSTIAGKILIKQIIFYCNSPNKMLKKAQLGSKIY